MSVSRRQFLTYLGLGSYAMLRAPASPAAPAFPLPRRKGSPPGFTPIAASTTDALLLPEAFRYDRICSWNDPLGMSGPLGPEKFGFNNDLLAYFPIDALRGGKFDTLLGEITIRDFDGQATFPYYAGFTYTKADFPFKRLKDVVRVTGEEVLLSKEEVEKVRAEYQQQKQQKQN